MSSFFGILKRCSRLDYHYASVFGAFAIVFASSLWAIDGAFLRPNLYSLDVFNVVFLEHLIAFVIMIPFFLKEIKEVKKLKLIDWVAFSGIALFGGAIGTIAITKAFFMAFASGHSSISVVVLIQKLQPVFAIILAAIILREKPKLVFYPLAGIAFIGSYLVAFGATVPSLSVDNLSILIPSLALVAAISFGIGTVLGKFSLKKVSFRMGTYLRFGLTTAIMLVVNIVTLKILKIPDIGFSSFKLLLIIAFSTGALAIFIYYWGLKRVMASHATIFELGFPITALVIDFLVHDKVLSLTQCFGAVLILGSIIMISRLRIKK